MRTFSVGSRDDPVLPYRSCLDGTPQGAVKALTHWCAGGATMASASDSGRVRVTVTGNRAESLSPYLKKGSRVYVEGRLEARPWTDQQGQTRPEPH